MQTDSGLLLYPARDGRGSHSRGTDRGRRITDEGIRKRTPLWGFPAAGLAILVLGVSLTAMFAGESAGSTKIYLAVARWELFDLGHVVSETALLSLVAAWAVTAVMLVWRKKVESLLRLIAGGAGSVLAYALSEVLKRAFTQTRPCTTQDVLAACPPAENWSYPSNHTVIAAALAISMILSVPVSAVFTVPLAFCAGAARVVAGHHYPHDVVAGVVLGISVTAAVVLVAAPLLQSRPVRSIASKCCEAVTEGRCSRSAERSGAATPDASSDAARQ